jgi:hypothetical protein
MMTGHAANTIGHSGYSVCIGPFRSGNSDGVRVTSAVGTNVGAGVLNTAAKRLQRQYQASQSLSSRQASAVL